MPVELGPGFAPSFAGIPPHISQSDLALWERFRRAFAPEYVRLYFDVGLGRGEIATGPVSPNVAAAWQRLTRFRADVVGDRGESWDIIELRPNAGTGAVGALQVYATLWQDGPPDRRPIRAVLVTDFCSEDLRLVARLAGIDVRCIGA